MLRWIKNCLIPHQGNDHHPHLLRGKGVLLVLATVIAVESVFLLSVFVVIPGTNLLALIAPSVLMQSANASREINDQKPLTTNLLLEQAARLKAEDMATKGYFAHTSPDGTTPWYWLRKVGYRYVSAGENLAVNFIDSSDVHAAWMQSPSHRANIVNGKYSEIGIATAQGIYKGREVTFVVQFFGKPRVARAATIPGASVAALTVNQPTILSSIMSAPSKATNSMFFILAGFVGLALALMILIRGHVPHPRIIALPAAIFAVVLAFVIANHELATRWLEIL